MIQIRFRKPILPIFSLTKRKLGEITEVLTNSTRKYENIRLNLARSRSPISIDLKENLEIRGRKWKKIELFWPYFETASDLMAVLTYIDPTVTVLRMVRVESFDQSQIEGCELEFPKLVHLELNFKYNQILMHQNIFENCQTLKGLQFTVSISKATNDTSYATMVHAMLLRNKGLKKLTFIGFILLKSHCSEFLNIDISEGVQCQLTSLSISFKKLNKNQKSNLKKLLLSVAAAVSETSYYQGVAGIRSYKQVSPRAQLDLPQA